MNISSAPASDPSAWLQGAAEACPQQLFLRTLEGRTLNYRELREQSGRYAAALASRGARGGERVLVQADNSPEYVLLYLACLELGAVFVPINTANTPIEVEYLLNDCDPCLAVVRPGDVEALQARLSPTRPMRFETLDARGEGSLSALARIAVPAALPRPPAASPAALIYTSGTTGRSKGAILTRANLAANASALADAWRFTASDVLLHALPLFHIHGLFAALNTVLVSRASLVLLPKFETKQVLAHLPGVSVYMGVPTHYTRLLQSEELNRACTATMRLFVSGSAPLLAETLREFEQRTAHRILERYGMTETLIITSNPYAGTRKAGAVGPPLPGTEVRVRSLSGEQLEREHSVTGALEVKSPSVFAGYWRDALKTRAEFSADGWFKTGDLGFLDAEGYVHIVGRAKDLVISGGYNVYPKEVERELDAIPGVLESAVIGAPHPDLGEGVTAVVVLRPGATLDEEAIGAALEERVSRYKRPRRILVVAELPRNAMGKVQKNLLRSTYAHLYEDSSAAERSH